MTGYISVSSNGITSFFIIINEQNSGSANLKKILCTKTGSKSIVIWIGLLVVLSLMLFEAVFQSILGRLPKRGRKRRERIDEGKNVQTAHTRTYCRCSRPLSYCYPNCRTPRHWKFTQHHRTTRPPPCHLESKLFGA